VVNKDSAGKGEDADEEDEKHTGDIVVKDEDESTDDDSESDENDDADMTVVIEAVHKDTKEKWHATMNDDDLISAGFHASISIEKRVKLIELAIIGVTDAIGDTTEGSGTSGAASTGVGDAALTSTACESAIFARLNTCLTYAAKKKKKKKKSRGLVQLKKEESAPFPGCVLALKIEHYMDASMDFALSYTVCLEKVEQSDVDILKAQVAKLLCEMKTSQSDAQKHMLPKGSILMWSGSEADIPEGFALCDGSKATPDLRGRFVIGSSSTYSIGSRGGSITHSHTVTVHGHQLTVAEMPSHAHGVLHALFQGSIWRVCDKGSRMFDRTSSTSGTSGGNQAHSHRSSCATVSHIPPYYAICYVMKVV
jgi:hypothetical protein